MNYQIAVIPGDGIGPDVVEQTLNVMDKVGEKFGHTFNYTKVLAGGCAIDATGACLPQETIDICKASDAVLLGAVGGWKWDNLPGDQRPERALLGLRKALGLFANLRIVCYGHVSVHVSLEVLRKITCNLIRLPPKG